MIVAQNIGRLGNNFFQIAAAMGYARKYGFEWGVDPSMGNGPPYTCLHDIYPHLPKGELNGNRYQEHPNGYCPQHNTTYDICHYDYHVIPNLGPNVRLTGFFQSWKYFENCQEEVKNTFPLAHVPGFEDYVSIHVRRGDYVQHSGSFPPITVPYVEQAMNKIRTGKAMVFSDDIPWCKENLNHLNTSQCQIEYSEGRGELQDLSLMASCGHHIIANSSFSWWAAYLGHNPDRMVISPSCKRGQWYGLNSGIKKDCVDLLPPNWHQIEFR